MGGFVSTIKHVPPRSKCPHNPASACKCPQVHNHCSSTVACHYCWTFCTFRNTQSQKVEKRGVLPHLGARTFPPSPLPSPCFGSPVALHCKGNRLGCRDLHSVSVLVTDLFINNAVRFTQPTGPLCKAIRLRSVGKRNGPAVSQQCVQWTPFFDNLTERKRRESPVL